jgi:hypothetical protein
MCWSWGRGGESKGNERQQKNRFRHLGSGYGGFVNVVPLIDGGSLIICAVSFSLAPKQLQQEIAQRDETRTEKGERDDQKKGGKQEIEADAVEKSREETKQTSFDLLPVACVAHPWHLKTRQGKLLVCCLMLLFLPILVVTEVLAVLASKAKTRLPFELELKSPHQRHRAARILTSSLLLSSCCSHHAHSI